MSLLDIFHKYDRPSTIWDITTLTPPPLTIKSLVGELRYFNQFYKHLNLTIRIRIVFLSLKLIQRISYNIGWKANI